MKIHVLKSALVLSCGLLGIGASAANAATSDKLVKPGPLADADHVIYTPARGAGQVIRKAGCGGLTNHGGPVIVSAKVVFIFWGPSFAAGGADNTYATTLQAFRNLFGSTAEYAVVTLYGSTAPVNLGSGTADWFDSSTPPTNVTDAIVRSKITAYLSTHAFNASTIYEVVIPSTSYSSSGTSTSCGGPSLAYCAYHGHYTSGGDVKYSIQPWPGCSGCSVSGWSNVQNQEHFVVHETREAVTDPDLNAWYDSCGNEADDKCAWSPPPFFGTGGYGYQYEWSNASKACIKTR
jgi:hypothetical protein